MNFLLLLQFMDGGLIVMHFGLVVFLFFLHSTDDFDEILVMFFQIVVFGFKDVLDLFVV